MGGVLAELLVNAGCRVSFVTTSAMVSDWTVNTLEQHAIQTRLLELGVELHLNKGIEKITANDAELQCKFTAKTDALACDGVVMVASRLGNDTLWRDLTARRADWTDAGIRSVKLIGDADAPGPIAWATYAGHRYARELDEPDIGDALPFRREVTALSP
jgi:dimethylamine/trimethylamine dehydrogenase